MLTFGDHIRLRAKDAEFSLPRSIRKLALASNIFKNPYIEQDNDLRYIFIHVPKAAGTSLRRALYGTKSFHIPAVRYQIAGPERFETYFKFCFVRNPWDRLLSAYEYLRKRCDADMSFPDHRWAASNLSEYNTFHDFVISLEDEKKRQSIKRYIHFRDQIDWIQSSGLNKKILVDFVARYESFQADYAEICGKLDLPAPSLPSERKSTHGQDYRVIYTPRMVDLVGAMYRADIKAFGYEFE